MRIENIKIGLVKPYSDNAKRHTNKQIQAVADSIERFGFLQPLVIDKDNVLIIGHCRLLAAKELDMQSIPVVRAENLTEDEVKALRLADNKLNESEWDMKLALPELKLLSPDLFNLTGFDSDLLLEPDAQDDVIPENVPSLSKLGDLYELGQHRVLCGDSTEENTVLRLMDGKKADMVFTDPPYGVNMSRSLVSGRANSIKNDQIEGLEALLEKSFINASFVAKKNAQLYCWIGFRAYSIAERIINGIWKVNNCIVWKKPSIGLGGKGYRLQHELCIFSGNILDKSLSDIWELKRDRSGLHPTMKPIELVERALINSSNDSDIVMDLFLGSGSTLIASEKTNRICYGMELDPKYVDVIVQRYVDYVDNPVVKCNGVISNLWTKSQKAVENAKE